jgi:hypothetical protein
MIITKRRNGGDSWSIYHTGIASDAETDVIYFETGAAFDNATFWNDTAPTSSVFSVGSASSANPFIAYCFAEKKGFSKFGSYTGNGSTDGPFIYTGSRIKVDGSDAESSNIDTLDITSNGFKLRDTNAAWNGSGTTYIYMCFAENPLVSSAGVPCTAR